MENHGKPWKSDSPSTKASTYTYTYICFLHRLPEAYPRQHHTTQMHLPQQIPHSKNSADDQAGPVHAREKKIREKEATNYQRSQNLHKEYGRKKANMIDSWSEQSIPTFHCDTCTHTRARGSFRDRSERAARGFTHLAVPPFFLYRVCSFVFFI